MMITIAYRYIGKSGGAKVSPLLSLLCVLMITALTSCDTTEDGLEVCSKEDVTFGISLNELNFSAGVSTEEFVVTGNVSWDISVSNDAFECSPKSGRGETKVTVRSRQNQGTSILTGIITVNPVNTGDLLQQRTISVTQLYRNFEVKVAPDNYNFKQSGGQTYFEFESTVPWEIDILDENNNVIDMESCGLTVSPLSGDGAFQGAARVNVAFGRNDTKSGRRVKLRMKAQNESDAYTVGKLMPEYNFTQEPATDPIVTALLDAESRTEKFVSLTLAYTSVTPVSGCGVYLSQTGGSETKIPVSAASFDFTASGITLMLNGLEAGTEYTAVPYIESALGETKGNPVLFSTLFGLRFGKVEIIADIKGVSFSVPYSSLLPVSEIGVKIFDMSGAIVKEVKETSGLNADGTVSVLSLTYDALEQNTKYTAKVFGSYKSKDGVSHDVEYGETLQFQTGTRKPGEDDNKPFRIKR